MMDMVSYQAPTSALPNAGLAWRVSVLTTIRSMISPGIRLESNTLVVPGMARISETSGFQVTTAVGPPAAKAETRSASEVLTTVTSRSRQTDAGEPRASR
jgi:hypothetical protein